MGRTVFHIGASKTGTTTLQNNVFAQLSSVHNIGKPYSDNSRPCPYQNLIHTDDFFYPRQVVSDHFDQAVLGVNGDKTIVLSDEAICDVVTPSVVARRLHDLCPSAKVLLTIRNQIGVVESLYRFDYSIIAWPWIPHKKKKLPVSFDDFFDHHFGENLISQRHFQYANSFDYGAIAQGYAETFGQENVVILLLEELKEDPQTFGCKLADVLGADDEEVKRCLEAKPANVGSSDAFTAYARLRSYMPSFFKPIADDTWRRYGAGKVL